MKVGSLVECIIDLGDVTHIGYTYTPKEKNIYLVCDIYYSDFVNDYFIYIEEHVNPEYENYVKMEELPYPMKWFIEVQPPMSLTALLEEPQFLTLKYVV